MSRRWTALAFAAALVVAAPARAEGPVAAAAPAAPEAAPANFDDTLLTIDEARARYPGRLSQVVLRFLSLMETAVNKDKAAASAVDWEPLGGVIDRDRFHRVGNFAEHMGWQGYSQLLTGWAKSNWWKGYIWRMSEVPATGSRPGLVYVEAQERSSREGPVVAGGKHFVLESISVYEIDGNDRIVGLHVYDHKPR